MLRIIFTGIARAAVLMQRYVPSLRLITRIRRRDGLKWGLPAMPIAGLYFLLARLCQELINGGGSWLLSIPMLWCLIIGIAFLTLGPVSVVMLIRARAREAIQRRQEPRQS